MAQKKKGVRKMTAKQLHYFGTKAQRAANPGKGGKSVAKKKGVRRSRGRGGGFGGSFNSTVIGLGAGVARQVGNRFLPGYGAPLGELAVGWFTKNPTALYMSGRDLGGMVSAGFVGGANTDAGGYL